MSEVWICVDEASRGSVPARCAKTGERCITRVNLPAKQLSAAWEWCTWTALWPWRREPADASVIVSLLPRVQRRHRLLVTLRDVLAAAIGVTAVVAVAAGGQVSRSAVTALVGLLAVKGLVALVGYRWAVDVRTDATGRWIRVDRVHPAFVEAVAATTTRPEEAPTLVEAQAAEPATTSPASDQASA